MRRLGARDAKRAVTIFRALSDPTRLSLVNMLADLGTMTGPELAHLHRSVTRQAVQAHLALLEDARLLTSWKEGRHRLWKVNPNIPSLHAVWPWLAFVDQGV